MPASAKVTAMAAAATATATQSQAIQLYRRLLRETSYLPPSFRSHIANIVKDRFRRNQHHDAHAKAHISRAARSLRIVRNANGGDKTAMASLISKGFARVGPRRRDIMAEFVKKQGPSDSKSLESLLSADTPQDGAQDVTSLSNGAESLAEDNSAVPRPKKRKDPFYEKWDLPKLAQFLKSQRQHQGETKVATGWPTSQIKSVNSESLIPKLNIWGKPIAECVSQTKREKWWKRMADKMMVPLGKGEWELLQQLGDGAQREGLLAIPARRTPARLMNKEDENSSRGDEAWDWERHATQPAAQAELRNNRFVRRRNRAPDEPTPYTARISQRPISARWFQRAYSRTWTTTPHMQQDPNTLRHKITWGSPTPKIPPATESQLDVFRGVDTKGKLFRTPPQS